MYRLKKTHKITKIRERVRYKEKEIKRDTARGREWEQYR